MGKRRCKIDDVKLNGISSKLLHNFKDSIKVTLSIIQALIENQVPKIYLGQRQLWAIKNENLFKLSHYIKEKKNNVVYVFIFSFTCLRLFTKAHLLKKCFDIWWKIAMNDT